MTVITTNHLSTEKQYTERRAPCLLTIVDQELQDWLSYMIENYVQLQAYKEYTRTTHLV